MFSLTAIILTRNEAENIGECLRCLGWVDEVIIVDSFSNDQTIACAKTARPDVRIFKNTFQDFGQQRNWALDQTNPKNEWILFVDADERITADCAAAIRQAVLEPRDCIGFLLCYRNMFLGRWIKHCTHFPSWQLRLLKNGRVRFQKEGHGQREVTSGALGYLRSPFDHLDLSKGIDEWIKKHEVYSSQEIELLLRLRDEPLRLRDLLKGGIERRRCLKRLAAKMGSWPLLWFLYVYVFRCGFLDGRAGWSFCRLRYTQQAQMKAKLKQHRATSAVEFHDRLAGKWEGKYSKRSFIGRRNTLEQCLNGSDLRGQRWLDAGCGTGTFARLLAARGCSVTGIDASAEMISEASEQSSQIAFRQIANLESIEIEPSSLDGVLCISVLEYLNDPSATLRKLATGLRAGGSLIVSVPNRSSLLRKGLGGAFQVTNKLAGEGWPPYFEFSRHEYSASDFADLLNACNLRIEKQLFLGGPLPEAFQRSPVLGPLIMFKARKAA